MSNADNDGGFLSGWSRRKLAVKREKPVVVEDEVIEPIEEAEPDDYAELIAALPALDDITEGTDIKPFLVKGIPASLKNAALRKLWSATPSVRDYADPAVDYAWDWNAPGGVPGGGGILSESSVAKMVKDLIGTRKEAEEQDVSADEADNLAAEDLAVEVEAEPPLEAVRRSGPREPAALPAAQAPDDAPRDQSRTLTDPPRRHGSAMPQ